MADAKRTAVSQGTGGDPGVVDTSNEARFGRNVTPLPNGCWRFGSDLDAYSTFSLTRANGMAPHGMSAHRFAYETMVGKIPKGYHLHHECEHPGCVNPDHLVPLTPADHKARHAEMRRTA